MTTVMKKNATLQVRVNPQIKRGAQKTLQTMGLDVSTAVNMFLHQVIITQSIPFESRTINGFTPERERAHIVAAKDRSNGKFYRNVDEMMDAA